MSIRDTEIIVSEEGKGLRLDQFLAARLPQYSRAYLQKMIAGKQILRNHHQAYKGDLLVPGDRIQIKELLEKLERIPAANPKLPIAIVYIDEFLAVLDKPPGIPTHPVRHEETETVVNFWLAIHPEAARHAPDPLRAGIVHRLDTDTSGLLMVARHPEGVEALQNQFRRREVGKVYLALVMGAPPAKGTIDIPLVHDPKSKRRMMAVRDRRRFPQAREALTEFEVVEKFRDFTLLRVRTRTGRMHQVRVHLAFLGHPLVGEPIYLKAHEREQMQRCVSALESAPPVTRHFLHAAELSFTHPQTGQNLEFTSALAPDMAAFLHRLKGS